MKTFASLVDYLRAEVYLRTDLVSAQQITEVYCPYAQGINVDGLIVPSPEQLVGNSFVNVWCDRLVMYNVHQIDYWLKETSEFVELSMNEFLASISPMCMQNLLPYICYIPIPRNILIRQGTLIDLISEYNI